MIVLKFQQQHDDGTEEVVEVRSVDFLHIELPTDDRSGICTVVVDGETYENVALHSLEVEADEGVPLPPDEFRVTEAELVDEKLDEFEKELGTEALVDAAEPALVEVPETPAEEITDEPEPVDEPDGPDTQLPGGEVEGKELGGDQ